MQAVILAAGEGKRLRPLTRSMPKALIQVGNQPIIGYVIESLVESGIHDIIVVTGYRKEHVIRYLNTNETDVTVVTQKKQIGTADAMKAAENEISGDFLVLPGDNYIDSESIRRIKDKTNAILVKEHNYPSNFGVAIIKDGYLEELVEKPRLAPTHTVSTGIYSFSRSVFDRPITNKIPDLIMGMRHDGIKIKAVYANDWQDAIYPWDLLRLNSHMLKRHEREMSGTVSSTAIIKGDVIIGKGSEIGPYSVISGPVMIGEGCVIGSHTVIDPDTTIGSRCNLGAFTYVGRSLLMEDTKIGTHSRISDAIIGEGCTLADHLSVINSKGQHEIEGNTIKAEFGAVFGERVTTFSHSSFKNTIIGNNARIEGRVPVISDIPDSTVVM